MGADSFSPLNFSGSVRLFFQLFQSLAVIITFSFFLSQISITRMLFNLEDSPKKQVLLGIFFGIISITGTYLGVPINDAIANVRDIGPIAGGLFGGPVVGAIAGLIGGVHRASMGGFSAYSCAFATISNGLLAGFLYKFKQGKNFSPIAGFFVGVIGESWHMLLVLLVTKPYNQAYTLVRNVSWPMILTNAFGVFLFLIVIQVSQRQQSLISAISAETVLKITEKTLPILSKGFNPESADAACKIILKYTNLDAVGIADTHHILAFRGLGSDHHLPNSPVKTVSTLEALKTGDVLFLSNKNEIGCDNENCPLSSGVVAPLKTSQGETFGALKLYRKHENDMNAFDFEMAKGLASILATQIELNKIEQEKRLRIVSQLKELQSHINPHFLFNTLNTINFVLRKDPEQARQLIYKLSFILRQTIERESSFVPLSEEIKLVKAYLEIEKERFGERLEWEFDIDEKVLDTKVPSIIIQPIVENSVKHGFSIVVKKVKILVNVYERLNKVYIVVEDNGKGIEKESLESIINNKNPESIGISNVKERIFNIYGKESSFKIKSLPNKGTRVVITIPSEGASEWLSKQLLLTTKGLQEKS
ncbi:MAG: LytS/YhcK type 5TM receptor domain-containing protein [Caldisericaceae bacterium]